MRAARILLTALAGLAVVALAGCAGDIPQARLEAKYANAASRFATLPDGVRVHYRDQGAPDGPPIVMVHGFSANLDAWEPWVRRLGGTHRIITLDLPAHGLTVVPEGWRISTPGYVEVVDQLTRSLHVDRFALAGNSMGGGVAWSYALAHPERVSALILVDAVGLPAPSAKPRREGPPAVFALMRNPVGRAVLRRIDPRPLAERGLKQAYVDPALVTPALVDRYVELARAPRHRELLLTAAPPVAPSAEALRRVSAPTLVLHGERDALIPVESGRATAAAIPGARLIVYPGVGHVPMEQIPDRSAADVEAFLATAGQSAAQHH